MNYDLLSNTIECLQGDRLMEQGYIDDQKWDYVILEEVSPMSMLACRSCNY